MTYYVFDSKADYNSLQVGLRRKFSRASPLAPPILVQDMNTIGDEST